MRLERWLVRYLKKLRNNLQGKPHKIEFNWIPQQRRGKRVYSEVSQRWDEWSSERVTVEQHGQKILFLVRYPGQPLQQAFHQCGFRIAFGKFKTEITARLDGIAPHLFEHLTANVTVELLGTFNHSKEMHFVVILANFLV